ncbi:MAG TPA: sigma-70 family RNA polymerase sigma factor [Candidatus Angelobacter sp.]|nr:sigma-70 family RNA polymerase sigma factor [Candidatus Angelobacter sp.]
MAPSIRPDRRRSEQRHSATGMVMLSATDRAQVVAGKLVDLSSCGFRVQHAYAGFKPGQMLCLGHAGQDSEVRVMWVRHCGNCVECGLLQCEAYCIQGLKAGHPELFSELLAPYMRNLRCTINSILHNFADTEDVLQESLLKVLTHLDQFQLGRSFKAWLLQIGANEARKCLRKNRWLNQGVIVSERENGPTPRFVEEACDQGATPAEAFERQELLGAVHAAAEGLDEIYRDVFLLRDVCQLQIGEVAALLGLSVETANTRLHRARLQIRARLRSHILLPGVDAKSCVTPR